VKNLSNRVLAKRAMAAFIKRLKREGHTIEAFDGVVDVISRKNGKDYFWEIKASRPKKKRFNPVSITIGQIKIALSKPRFKIVLANDTGKKWQFKILSLSEFLVDSKLGSINFLWTVPRPLNSRLNSEKLSKTALQTIVGSLKGIL